MISCVWIRIDLRDFDLNLALSIVSHLCLLSFVEDIPFYGSLVAYYIHHDQSEPLTCKNENERVKKRDTI